MSARRNKTRIRNTLVTALVLSEIILVGMANELNLHSAMIDHWASEFGNTLYSTSVRVTGLEDLIADYMTMAPKVEPIDGTELLMQTKAKMEEMLNKKVEAVNYLVDVAQEAHRNHIDQVLHIDYPNAKKLDQLNRSFPLEENEHFNYIRVNLNESTVHVPTNVYDESFDILNGVAWSTPLDEKFRENYENDPTLTWQYFGSSSGFLRNYPGVNWQTQVFVEKGVDLYDCRTEGWYIQAATSPKDIVILLDASGSMTGQRLEIAKSTVKKILDTLSDDDFFNVIKFSDRVQYVSQCFNRSLIQANADNKKHIKEALNNVTTQNIAAFDKALIEAFELFLSVPINETSKGAGCNRAIMIISDGSPDTYEEIFTKYNTTDKVRIFTFLIGREVADSKQLTWMACANKGVYSRISTLADVHEKVQNYVQVLSRPMVISREDNTGWTSVYVDAAHDAEGLQLMTSVAQPVFDIRNTTLNAGILLGVMGSDVPIKELMKLTPPYKMGVNGYAFVITNNGYVLYHPDFRPREKELIKPNYNSVDLSEVELSAEQNEENDFPVPDYESELRTKMIDGDTGKLKMKVLVHYDNMKRVAIRENNYFFTSLNNTPFSLGIALPVGYGVNYVNGRRSFRDIDRLTFLASPVKIAPWNYCKMETTEARQDPLEMLFKYLDYGKAGVKIYADRCDQNLISSLSFDVLATKGALNHWRKSISADNKYGIELVFLGTKGGLTRYYNVVDTPTDPQFIERNNRTIEELYYKKAVEGGEGVFTFSVPLTNAGESSSNGRRDPAHITLTVSSAIFIADGDRVAVTAVVGFQMRYLNFYQLFMNSTRTCSTLSNDNCNFTCESQEIDCYLLDTNGFVVLSKEESQIGKFFGEVDAALMKEFMHDMRNETLYKERLFQKIRMYDYQGFCNIYARARSGAASFFVDPVYQIIKLTMKIAQKLALLLIDFISLQTFWHWKYAIAQGNESDYYVYPGSESASDSSSVDWNSRLVAMFEQFVNCGVDNGTVKEWQQEVVKRFFEKDGTVSEEELSAWFSEKKTLGCNRITGHEACVKELQLFRVRTDALPFHGTQTNCESCERSYTIHQVPKTNLLLLVADALCNCKQESVIKVEPVKVNFDEDMQCRRLQMEIHRRRPAECYSFHPQENSTQCGGGNSLVSSYNHHWFVIMSLLTNWILLLLLSAVR